VQRQRAERGDLSLDQRCQTAVRTQELGDGDAGSLSYVTKDKLLGSEEIQDTVEGKQLGCELDEDEEAQGMERFEILPTFPRNTYSCCYNDESL